MSWFTTNLIGTLLLPPLSLLILIGAGIFLPHCKIARRLGILAFILLWLASTPFFAEGAMHLIEGRPLDESKAERASAIVILGGGSYFHAPEYADLDTVNKETLLRLRYGARLQRQLHLPVLVSGGRPLGNSIPEAQQMRAVLEQDFAVPVRWTEDTSDNTYENARNSYRILQKNNIRKIYLVTHASHMMRAAAAFRLAGFDVIEAPTGFTTRYHTDLLTFLPRARSLDVSAIFAHETIGMLWYRARSLFSK
jgi:uncharacterized SAM-binding protein YcdF (DUF218 family)